MRPWTSEDGTLWALESANGLPPLCPARVEAAFEEVAEGALGELAAAMELPTAELIRARLEGKRRCFALMVDGRIACYGWVTRGAESVGELERRFNLQDDEAYIWDCRTLPEWRGQRLYSALLSQMIRQLGQEGVPRIWIGAGRRNRPSIRGFANAGFEHVVDCDYWRFWRVTFLWIDQRPSPERPLVSAAYRLLINDHERRWGRLAIGFKRHGGRESHGKDTDARGTPRYDYRGDEADSN